MNIIIMTYEHCIIVKKIGLEYQMYKKHIVIVEVYKYSMIFIQVNIDVSLMLYFFIVYRSPPFE